MTSRERVLTALRREQPDRVPYCELAIDRSMARQLMGWPEPAQGAGDNLSPAEAKALASFLEMDNIVYGLRPPIYARTGVGLDGRVFYGDGLIKTEADLDLVQLPDPHSDAFYAEARAFAREKGEFAACLVTRIGIFPTLMGLGLETFSLALYENRSLIEALLDRYVDWSAAIAERAASLGFDVFVSTDDMAFKSAPFFSPAVFRELVLPRYRRVAAKLDLPWILHSDGNLLPFLDDLAGLGIAGFHPVEKGAMDIRAVKRDYGRRLCLLGNVDLNILGMGTPQEAEAEVRALIRDVAPGGGYIVTSGNSLAGYLRPENIVAMARAVQKYGTYPGLRNP